MIVRTPDRPITYADIKMGSLLTILTKSKNLEEYIVIKYINGVKGKPYIEGLQIVKSDTKEKNTHYLYADKVVLLHRVRIIRPGTVQSVQARLARDIVEDIIHAEAVFQKKEEKRKGKSSKTKLGPGFVSKGNKNSAWGSLQNETGFIKIYRG